MCEEDERAERAELGEAGGGEKRSTEYEVIADKVGFVPNVRLKDNLFQLLCVGVFAVLVGGIIGGVWKDGTWAVIGVMAGLVAGALVSGVVLCVVGLLRK